MVPEQDATSPKGLGGLVAAGSLVACAAGLAFALFDAALAASAPHAPGAAGAVEKVQFLPLAARSLRLILPCSALIGVALGALVVLVGRVSVPAGRAVRALVPLTGVGLAFAYGAAHKAASSGALTGKHLVVLALLSPAAVGTAWALGTVLVRRLLASRTARLAKGLAGLLAVLWLAALFPQAGTTRARCDLPESVPPSQTDRPSVLLIVLDTVRADHMSCYGYGRQTTPSIDRWAAGARIFENVMSPGGWTLPSHASIFTGMPVSAHGCTWGNPHLDHRTDTLAKLLRGAGYQTVGLSSNKMLLPDTLLTRGFETWWAPRDYAEPGPASVALADRLVYWLRPTLPQPYAEIMHGKLADWVEAKYDPARPFFAFLNYIEAHQPYVPPSQQLRWATEDLRRKWRDVLQIELLRNYTVGFDTLTPGQITELETLYDEEVAYVDSKVGELLDWTERMGLAENLLVIITSDHGEHFGEHHVMEHKNSLYEPILRVPLIIRHPGSVIPGRDARPAQTHDIFATVLKLTGVEWGRTPAQNCRGLIGDDPGHRPCVAEFLVPWSSGEDTLSGRTPAVDNSHLLQPQAAVQVDGLKLLCWQQGRRELHDVAADPMEHRDLAGERPDDVARLEAELEGWRSRFEPYQPPPGTAAAGHRPTPEQLRAMRGLGYIR